MDRKINIIELTIFFFKSMLQQVHMLVILCAYVSAILGMDQRESRRVQRAAHFLSAAMLNDASHGRVEPFPHFQDEVLNLFRFQHAHKKYEEALRLLHEAILPRNDERTRAWAYYYLAKMHEQGLGVQKSTQKMFELLEKAGEIVLRVPGLLELRIILSRWGVLEQNFLKEDPLGKYLLHLAVEKGYLELVNVLLLSREIDVNAKRENGKTPLLLAVELDKWQIASDLLDHDASIKLCDNEGWGPFKRAIERNNAAMISLIIRKRNRATFDQLLSGARTLSEANLNYQTREFLENESIDINTPIDDLRPLELALKLGSFESVKALIDAGASVGVFNGSAPLVEACDLADEELVKKMLEKGACAVSSRYSDGWTPLHAAAKSGNLPIVAMILERGGDVNVRTATTFAGESALTPLHVAAQYGHVDVVILLLSKRADVCISDAQGRGSLHFAARGGCDRVVRELIAERADFSIVSNSGETALHVACAYGYPAIVKQLLTLGSLPQAKSTKGGWTPLHYAAAACLLASGKQLKCALSDQVRCAEYLVMSGAQVDEKSTDGWTALHLAAGNGNGPVAAFLIERVSNVHDVNKYWTPLHLAARAGVFSVLESLLKRQAIIGYKHNSNYRHFRPFKKCNPLEWTIRRGDEDSTKMLIEKDASLLDEMIFIGAFAGSATVVKALIGRGCNVDATDKSGKTALMCASSVYNQEWPSTEKEMPIEEVFGPVLFQIYFSRDWEGVVRFLLSNGAKVELVDDLGRTALHYACESGKLEVVSALLESGAHRHQKPDKQGQTPLSLALAHKHRSLVEMLIIALQNE